MSAIPPSYQHALDSGVYLKGVDSSVVGDRKPVDPRAIDDVAVILIIGQSNGGNHGDIRHSARRRVYNFNVFDGLCYPASDPLLGATGDGGSAWCILGDALIAAGLAPAILLAPLCVGGATVAQWAPGGPYHHRMFYCLERLRQAGFGPTYILCHLGEADSAYGTDASAYRRAFRSMVDSVRGAGVMAPIYAAVASHFAPPGGYDANQRAIRDAQTSLVDPGNGIFQGPDTDVIRNRIDGCHISGDGLAAHANSWRTVLVS
jgi:hypothetical protein